ncbi:MAG: Lrp/AsnC family transcriptional regulator [archaeon]|nr:Lrp/AsnC family transcriptional regulator [archaeon]
MLDINEKDLAILALLKKDAKLKTQEISRRAGMPVTTVHNRIKKLEENGIITHYCAMVDNKKLGINISAYVMINVEYRTPSGKKISQAKLAKDIKKNSLVDEASIVAGGTDIIIRIHAKNIDELNEFIINRLRDMDGVANTHTLVVLNEIH